MADDATDEPAVMVHRRIEDAVDLDPSAVAARHEGVTLTYRQMDDLANGLARELIDAGAGRGSHVLISGGHEPMTVVAMVGVLKTGAAFVVLDTGDPIARRQHVAERVDPVAVVVTGAPGTEVDWLDVPEVQLSSVVPSADRPGVDVDPDDPVYVLFTSGTSGHPKGVVATNHSVVRPGVKLNNPTKPGDVRLVIGRLCWLAGVSAVVGSWMRGGTLEFHDLSAHGTHGLADRVDRLGQKTLGMVPTLARSLFGELEDGRVLASLDRISFFGEQLWWSDLRLVAQHVRPDCVFVNSLGASETTGVCRNEILAGDVGDDEGPVPVGPVREHWRYRIVDENDDDVAPGTAGQLVLATPTLFPGYFNDAALDQERLRVDDDGTEWFWTGDMVIERPDEMLVHAGRSDFQMKINGVLVAPEEAEGVLNATPGVSEVAVVGATHRHQRPRLVAHVVTGGEDAPTVEALARRARAELPEPLVPTDIRLRTEPLPRLANGKVNRSLLTEQSAEPLVGRGGPPRNDTERQIVAVMNELLELEGVGRDDDFWALGGDSLGALELMARLGALQRTRLPLMAVVDSRTAASLAERLAVVDTGTDDVIHLSEGTGPPLVVIPGGGGTGLAFTTMAAELDDRTIVSVEHAGSQRRGLPSRTIESAAKRAIELMEPVAPPPFVLLGYSYGALVAYEAARRLEAEGRPPALLVLLDAAPSMRRAVEELGMDFEMEPRPKPKPARKRTRPPRGGKIRARLRNVQQLRNLSFRLQAMTAGLDRPGTEQHHLRLHHLAGRALSRYAPGSYGGRVLLVRSDGWPVRDPSLGWAALAPDIDVVEISGTHKMLPLLPAFADAVRTAMDGVEAAPAVRQAS